MGRKAKLKKQRQQAKQNNSTEQQNNPQNFIKEMNKEGYRLEKIQRSPEVPQDRTEPQI